MLKKLYPGDEVPKGLVPLTSYGTRDKRRYIQYARTGSHSHLIKLYLVFPSKTSRYGTALAPPEDVELYLKKVRSWKKKMVRKNKETKATELAKSSHVGNKSKGDLSTYDINQAIYNNLKPIREKLDVICRHTLRNRQMLTILCSELGIKEPPTIEEIKAEAGALKSNK